MTPNPPTREDMPRASLGLDWHTKTPGLAPLDAVTLLYQKHGLGYLLNTLSTIGYDDAKNNASQEALPINALMGHLRTAFPAYSNALDTSDFFTLDGQRVATPITIAPLALLGALSHAEITACVGLTGPLTTWKPLLTPAVKDRLKRLNTQPNAWDNPTLKAWLSQKPSDHPKTKQRKNAVTACQALVQEVTQKPHTPAKPSPVKPKPATASKPAPAPKPKPTHDPTPWEWMDIPRIAFSIVVFGAIIYGATLLDYQAMWNDIHYTWHSATSANDAPYIPPLDFGLTPFDGDKSPLAAPAQQDAFNDWLEAEWTVD